jgi:hypothetical protein
VAPGADELRLSRPQGADDDRVVGERGEPGLRVGIGDRTQVGVGVPGGGVAQAAARPSLVVIDERDDAPVGDRRDDQPGQPGQPGHCLVGIEGGDQFLGDAAEQPLASRGQVGRLLHAAPAGDVQEVQRHPLGRGDGADLHPDVEGLGVGLERGRLSCSGGSPVALLELRADGSGEGFPQRPPQQLRTGRARDAFALGVDVRHDPVAVHGDEADRHRLEDLGQAVLRLPADRDVPGGAQEPHGRARLVAQRPTPGGDPTDRCARHHDAILGLVVAAGVDGLLQQPGHSGQVVGGSRALKASMDSSKVPVV